MNVRRTLCALVAASAASCVPVSELDTQSEIIRSVNVGRRVVDSLDLALTSVPVILQADVSAVELLDQLAMTLCRDVPKYSRLLQTFAAGDPDCILIVEFHGASEAELRSRIDHLEALLRQERCGATAVMVEDVWGEPVSLDKVAAAGLATHGVEGLGRVQAVLGRAADHALNRNLELMARNGLFQLLAVMQSAPPSFVDMGEKSQRIDPLMVDQNIDFGDVARPVV